MSCATFSCSVARIVSYSSRCSGPSVIRRRMVCFGGSSVATAAFVRRTMNGRMRVASWPRRTGSPSFSIGVRKRRVKFFRDPSSPGIRKANCDHSSPRLFSIGVPDRHSRWRVSSRHTACVAFAVGTS